MNPQHNIPSGNYRFTYGGQTGNSVNTVPSQNVYVPTQPVVVNRNTSYTFASTNRQ